MFCYSYRFIPKKSRLIPLNIFKALLILSFLSSGISGIAQVGIGTDSPDPSAAVEIQSTTMGFLPPVMTKVQMDLIASPAQGLMVYCTDCTSVGLYVFSGFVFKSASTQLPSLESTEVYNATTGRIWMDRNLGASQVATASDDALAYGNLYQWGRASDGHEIRDPISSTASGPVTSGNEGANFITINPSDNIDDWLTPQDDTRWNTGTEVAPVKNTTHDPCPSGYRIPTLTEFDAERTTWSSNDAAGAFASDLKISLGGLRRRNNGNITDVGSKGRYWTSTIATNDTDRARGIFIDSGGAAENVRGNGYSVRCIKE